MDITLNAPLTLPSGQTVRNRLAKAAMTEGLADALGRPGANLIRLYELWSRSGCGILITGNVQVDGNHLERRRQRRHRPGTGRGDAARLLADWAAAGKKQGALMLMQISHAGRQTPRAVNTRPKAPSPIKLAMPGNQFGNPVALTEEEIVSLIDRFVGAARAAEAAGFDGVQGPRRAWVSDFHLPLAGEQTSGRIAGAAIWKRVRACCWRSCEKSARPYRPVSVFR